MEHDEIRKLSEELDLLLDGRLESDGLASLDIEEQENISVDQNNRKEGNRERLPERTRQERPGKNEQKIQDRNGQMVQERAVTDSQEKRARSSRQGNRRSILEEDRRNLLTENWKDFRDTDSRDFIEVDRQDRQVEADGQDRHVETEEVEAQDTPDAEMSGRYRKSRRKQKGDWLRRPAAAMEGYFKPSDGLWAAFCVPIVIMIIIFIQREIFPFGEESFLRTDMYHQYAPFFSEFRYKLNQGGSLLYSWDIGMGVNFSALYAYYLASPFNWLLILCPAGLVIEFMTYGIVLKIGLAGLAFAYYLKKHCERDSFGVGFFGIFYALSGYMAAYSWNIMWLDCIILFPLIMLGLERLVNEKNGLLYGVTLGLSILSNYYISIMICIFMVIYFGALLILGTGTGKKVGDYGVHIRQFCVYSLLAGGVAAAVLIPEIYALQMTASADSEFPKTISSYFSMFDMFARHIGNVETEIGLDHWPNIYCGVAVLMFFLLYLGCRQIRLKEKAVYCGLLLLFFASFSVNALNFIWHGFHFPNSLPCRQSFIYIFLMLLICYQAYSYLNETSWKQIAIAFWGAVIFVILAEKLVEQEHFKFYTYYVAILFLALYGGLLHLYKKKRVSYEVLMALALSVVSIESAVNTTVTSVTTTSRTSYIKDNEDVRTLTESLIPSSTFYRIEKVTRKTKNDGAWMNFPSVSLFSSTANADLTAFFKELGCEGNTNAYSITGSTPLVDSLFSVKYGLYSEEQEQNEMLELMDRQGDTWLYQRLATLPVGFVVSPELERDWQRDLGNPAEVQNNLCDVIGAERVLVDAGGENHGTTFRMTPSRTADYYVYISNKRVKEVKVKIGEDTQEFKNINRGFLLELGICQEGIEIEITNEEDQESLNARIYRFSNEGLWSVYDTLNRYPLTISRWVDTRLEGEVDAGQAGILFTSIPYDKGWTVTVDGEERESQKIFDTFLGVELSEGTHRILLSYEPEGLRTGFAISGISIGCLLILAWVGWRKRRRKAAGQEEDWQEEPWSEEENWSEDEAWSDEHEEISEEMLLSKPPIM